MRKTLKEYGCLSALGFLYNPWGKGIIFRASGCLLAPKWREHQDRLSWLWHYSLYKPFGEKPP